MSSATSSIGAASEGRARSRPTSRERSLAILFA
jgi:hypothetical protein